MKRIALLFVLVILLASFGCGDKSNIDRKARQPARVFMLEQISQSMSNGYLDVSGHFITWEPIPDSLGGGGIRANTRFVEQTDCVITLKPGCVTVVGSSSSWGTQAITCGIIRLLNHAALGSTVGERAYVTVAVPALSVRPVSPESHTTLLDGFTHQVMGFPDDGQILYAIYAH